MAMAMAMGVGPIARAEYPDAGVVARRAGLPIVNPADRDHDLVVRRSDLRPWWPAARPFGSEYARTWRLCVDQSGSVDVHFPPSRRQSVSAFLLPRAPGVTLSFVHSVAYRFGSTEGARREFATFRAKYRRCANGSVEPGGLSVRNNGRAYRQPGFTAEYDDDQEDLGTGVGFEAFRVVDRYIVHVTYFDFRAAKAPRAPVAKARTAVSTLIMDMARRAHRKARAGRSIHGQG